MTDKELNDMVYSDNPWERARAARNGYGLDILMLDKAPMVRTEVARQGYRPDILAYDADSWVRKVVAESGKLAIRRGNCYEIMTVK